jgi:hypothetical protein
MDVGLRQDWLFLQELSSSDPAAAEDVGQAMICDVDAWNNGARAEYSAYVRNQPHLLLMSSTPAVSSDEIRRAVANTQGVAHCQWFSFGDDRAHALLRLKSEDLIPMVAASFADSSVLAVPLDRSIAGRNSIRRHVDPIGQLWVPDQFASLCAVTERRLADFFATNPTALRHARLTPREFEELVAQIWDGLGYEVELTKQTRDGGYDVVAVRNREAKTKFLISCKHSERGRKVGLDPVRNLWAVTLHAGANKGILATTVTFTGPATAFLEAHPWQLEGRDHYGSSHQRPP